MVSPAQPNQPSPRLHSFIAAPQPPSQSSSPSRYGVRVLSPTKPTRHLSPRKFHQLQQQRRDVVLRNMLPLLPLAPHRTSPQSTPRGPPPKKDPVPWNPAWLPFPLDAIPVVSAKSVSGLGLSLASASLDEWLQTFDREVLEYESLEKFVQVKLPEALAFCEKMEQQIAETDARAQAEADAAHDQQPHSPLLRREVGRVDTQRSGRGRRRAHTTSAMTRFPVRFRVAVFASIVERAILAMTQSAALAHLKPWFLQARQELFRAVFADYDPAMSQRSKRQKPVSDRGNGSADPTDDPGRGDSGDEDVDEDEDDENDDGDDTQMSSDDEDDTRQSPRRRRRPQRHAPAASMETRFGPDAPRPLSFFLSRVPFILKLQDDSQRRTTRFQRHQVVLRRIVQSLYRSLGSVFHAWKMYTRQKHDERLNDKGAQLTAMVVLQRGLVRAIFVEWSKCTLRTKLKRAQEREAQTKRVYDDRVNELYKELFLLREQNARLERELAQAKLTGGGCGLLHEADDKENDDDEE